MTNELTKSGDATACSPGDLFKAIKSTTFELDVEDTYEGIKHIDMVPNLSPQNLASDEIGKELHAEPRLQQERLGCSSVGRTRVRGTIGERTDQ